MAGERNFTMPEEPKEDPRAPNSGGYSEGTTYNPSTGIADFTYGGGPGQIFDAGAWGGTSGAVVIGPDGKPYVDTNQSGRAQDVNRYRGVADAAPGRKAYEMDYGKGDADRLRSQGTRAQQGEATSLLGDAARGRAASGAVIRGHNASDDSFGSSLSAQAGARGGVANQAAATQAGAATSMAQQQGVAAHLGAARSGELTSARGAYSTGASAMRAGDYQQQALDQARNKARMQNEMTQRELNQARQLGYEGMALDVNEGAMNAGLAADDRKAGIYSTALNRETAKDDRMASFYGKAIGDVGKMGGDALKASRTEEEPKK